MFKKISNFVDGISHDIRLLKLKKSIIFSVIFLVLGMLSWLVGGRTDKVTIFYIFPRLALPTGVALFMWAISFAFCGFVFSAIVFGCEKYKRHSAQKIGILLSIMFLFTLCVYPLFFGALSPILTFFALLLSLLFCFFAIVSSMKLYSLWTILLGIHFLWLVYNTFLSIAFAFVN